MKTGTINAATDINAAPASGNFARYYGLAPVRVIGVNPSKSEYEKLTGRQLKDEPVYIQQKTGKDGKPFTNCRISVFVKTANPNDPELVSQIDFWLADHSLKSKDGKYKVIDTYGNTSWVTEQEYKQKAIPVGRNGKPLPITSNYTLMYSGQDRLIDFLKAYLGIPSSYMWDRDSNEWVLKQDELLKNCQCELDDVKKLFTGDFRELKEVFSVNKDSLVKVLFGVRPYDGKYYQIVYDKAMSFFQSSTKALLKDIQSRQASGGLSGYILTDRTENLEEFIPEILKEFKIPTGGTQVSGPKGFSNETPTFAAPATPQFGDGTFSDGSDLPF